MLTLIKRGCVWRRDDERFVELRHLLCVVHGKSVVGIDMQWVKEVKC